MEEQVCVNPNCNSYGQVHPNCKCHGYAGGGEVCKNGHGHQENCERHAHPNEIADNQAIHGNPQLAVDNAAVHQGLLGLLTKVGRSKSGNPHKSTEDYLSSVRKGSKSLNSHAKELFGHGHMKTDKDSRETLKGHLESLRMNPEQLLDVGGNLQDVLPGHAIHLAAKVGQAVSHLESLRPQQPLPGPLDQIMPKDKMKEAHYDRHLDIAQNPLHILQHAKDGTLLPSDMETLNAVYPSLTQVIKSKAMESLVEAKSSGKEIPYKMKMSLSLLLGQPLDQTMTTQAMQAIIKSAGPQQAQQQQKAEPKRKATNVEMKQINKVDRLYETPSERRELARR